MALRSRGLQMIDQALADMRAGRLASDQNQQTANDRYLTRLMATLPPSQQRAALLANPNWQKTGTFTIPAYQPTPDDQLHTMTVQDAIDHFKSAPQAVRQQGAFRLSYGADAPADTVKLLNAQDVTGNPQNWTPQVQQRQAIEDKRSMDANQQEIANQADRKFKQIDMPTSTANIGHLKAMTVEQLAAAGNQRAQTGKNVAETAKLTNGGGTASGGSDAAAIADAIVSGKQPPDLKGMYKQGAAVRAELARRGYDLTHASQDWTSTQKYLSTLNSQGQVRLRQAVDFSFHSLDIVDGLAQEWSSKGLPLLSKANLKAARSGAYGAEAQSLATRLDGQIGDMVSELAVVYKGGNSPTDEGLKLAAKNLQADWSYKALHDNVGLVKQNLTVRRNSITSAGVVANSGNQYSPNTGSGPASPSPATSKVIRYDASGKRIQ